MRTEAPVRDIEKVTDTIWEIPVSHKPGMRVPCRIVATEKLLGAMDEGVFGQIANVACLPGIVKCAYCMPDGHWGYGFPIGGVAAMDAQEGVISPGGIGFDINCGMRLVRTNLTEADIRPRLTELVGRLFDSIPAGVGSRGMLRLSRSDLMQAARDGARWCVERGMGWQEDLERTEESGRIDDADISCVSDRAFERGQKQLGTLGSGNHYLEIQAVRKGDVHDPETASAFGIDRDGQVCVMFHCGSRGFGHQVASDYLEEFLKAMPRYNIHTDDRELACCPLNSSEGRRYFAAMKAAVNVSFANRQVILHRVREVFSQVFGMDARELGMRQVYDVAHNTAKLERHVVDGRERELLVHRKGSTRAFGPGMEGLPQVYRATGQPVIIGGSMETGSYLLAGVAQGSESFYSTAHGSGRTMSRGKSRKRFRGKALQEEMGRRGIIVRTASYAGLAEEAGESYKDIDEVVEATRRAGLSRRVCRLVPLGNIKG